MDVLAGTAAERLSQIAERARPVALAGEQALPVLPALRPLLPAGALQRGQTVAVQGLRGVHSLALALAAEASRTGSWVAALGLPSLGVAAAAELGVVLERLVLVGAPGPAEMWPPVAASLIDSFDVVLVRWPAVSGTLARRVALRARERKAVLIPVGPGGWDEAADLRLTVERAEWEGPGRGDGRLVSRRVEVVTGGRRSPRPRRTALWLPDARGEVAAIPPPAAVPLRPPAGGPGTAPAGGSSQRAG